MSATTTEVLMPLMGESVNEATLVKWLKKPGDKIEKEEPLLEVSTDKVDTEIPAPASGYLLKTVATEGAVVAVNAVLAYIGERPDAPVSVGASRSATPASSQAKASPATVAGASKTLTVPASGAVRSSPLVRKLARDMAIDLTTVPGSGLNGRITKRDILAVNVPATQAHGIPVGGLPPVDRLKTELVQGTECVEGVPVRREKMSKMRRLIAEHMVRSVRVSPHVTTVFEIDLGRVDATRKRFREAFYAREGFKLTYTPFFIHAAVQAIKQHPIVNVSVDGDEVLFKDDINIGCAVAIDGGLIVPVIKKAGELSLLGIARKLNDLVTKARTKQLSPDDARGGTFSITNPGGFGSLTSNPIINQPQVAILGIGAVVKRPVVIDDLIGIRPMMLISLTFDHRVVDGEGGAKYLATLKQILETYDESPL